MKILECDFKLRNILFELKNELLTDFELFSGTQLLVLFFYLFDDLGVALLH